MTADRAGAKGKETRPLPDLDCPQPPWEEVNRLAALAGYGILDTPPEPAFDNIAALAADLLEAPIAVVNLVGADRQWFKSEVGIGRNELPLDVSICRHAILRPGVFVVPDLAADPLFQDNPLVHVSGGLRFYAGAPLETPDGLPIGTVCVLDTEPRPEGVSDRQRRVLSTLAGHVMALLEQRREAARAARRSRRLTLLAEASARLLQADDTAEMVRDLHAILWQEFQLAACFHYRCGATEASLAAVAGLTPEQEAMARRLEFGQTVCGTVAATREAAILSGIQTSEDTEVAFLRELGIDAYASYPLLAAHGLVGTLSFGRATGPFSPGELDVLRTLAGHVATATERLRAEAELRATFSGAGVGMALFDQDLRLTRVNPAFCAITGRTEGDLIGGTCLDLTHPDDREEAARAVGLVAAGMERIAFEKRYVVPDGAIVHVGVTVTALARLPDGRAEALLAVVRDITQRVRSEMALRESERQLRAAVLAAPFPMMLHAEDGEVLELSRKWTELTGYTRVELATHHAWGHLAYPDRYDQFVAAVTKEFETGGEIVAGEWPVRAKDGSTRFWDFRNVGLGTLPDGRGLQISAAADITERKAVEAALRLRGEEFHALADNIPLLCWMAQPDGHITWYNRRWHEYTGTTPEDQEGWGWQSVHDPALLQDILPKWRRALATGEPFDSIFPLRGADGVYRTFLTRAVPIRDDEGRITRWFGSNVDISEQEQARADLARLNATLEQRVGEALAERKLWADVFESSDALITALDHGHRILALNQACTDEFERIYGVRPKVGDSLSDLLAHLPDQRSVALAIWDRALAGEEFSVTEAFGDSERARPYFELRFNTLRDRQGRTIGAFQYGVDVTDRLRSQAALATAEEALRHSQKMEAVGQLTGGMAHDFNNLLQALGGCLTMIGRRVPEPKVQELVTAGRQAVDRGAKLVNQLMAFARREGLRPEPLDVRDRVLRMQSLIERTLRADISLEAHFQPGLWAVEADPTQLELALLNLAANARDAMPSGGTLTITADTVSLAPGEKQGLVGDFVRLRVTDTGCGMPPAVLERAFEPFFTTKEVGKGTGLGLAQVYGLAQQSGGTATVASEPGRGTTVTLLLARSSGVPGPARAHPSVTPAKGTGRVLMVEDEPLVSATVASALEEAGYEVTRVVTADEALPLLNGGARIDLLFTDVVMPGRLSGVDLAREARRLRPRLPVLVTTGYSEKVAEAIGVRVLSKPYDIDDLLNAVAEALGGRAA